MAHPIAEHLERALRATVEVARAFPADKLDFWPAANAMTVGEQIDHLTLNLDHMIAPVARLYATQLVIDIGDDPVARLTQAVSRVNDVLCLVRERDWEVEADLPEGDGRSVIQTALIMLEHTAHHRGQLIIALRLLGIDPPPTWPLSWSAETASD